MSLKEESMKYKQITVNGFEVQSPLKPCPWCRKTPYISMPLDSLGEGPEETWMWRINCLCRVKSEAYVSIRRTSKTDLSRFLDKLDELFDRWNAENPIKAYEKKIIDLREIPNLGLKDEKHGFS